MGETIKSYALRIRSRWSSFTPNQKRNILIAIVAFLVALIAILWIALRPNYVTIMSGLDNQSLGEVQTQLENLKIPSEIEGSSVLVPQNDANTARIQLAMAGLPKSGYIGYSSVSSSFGMTQDQFNLQVLNALQENLSNTIESINGVESAQVYIVMPQQQIFISQPEGTAKASVFLQLGTGVQLSPAQVAGIQQLVADSVKGLSVNNVTVVDQNGITLSSSDSANGALGLSTTTSSEIAIRQQLDQSMTQQLQAGLDQIVGTGNAVVMVHANISFNQVTTKSHILQPAPGQTTGLPTSTQTIRSSSTNGSAAGGPAGQASTNPGLSTYAANGSTGNSTSTSSQSTTNYANSYVNTTKVADPVQINGYSVAVFLNGTSQSIPSSTLNQIKNFVANAVGQAAPGNRNSISVAVMPFNKQQPVQFPQKNNSLLYAGLGLLALIVLGGGFFLYRRNQRSKLKMDEQLVFANDAVEELGNLPLRDEEKMKEQLATLASKKPEEFASLLRSWLMDS
ncbi:MULTISPECIES: flagellar basal-body MS-ring/collar protein FliF [Alicyclobacillus]|uniref:Flagellar M-ring protein n=2 Tax=Alicyclobacillus tolerans TaxID=90970 RepID=A0ABT9LX40_9BACL|nr:MULTISPECIES: flagellar basal-body MS-ring/collar protein FliF [Alicyclobacillus]MDP9728842.1 flagellar M-ring protein FliF [Alicyclobacillus tengchongensis]SHK34946.1 flagellar M-ring protein FliF [Alicyclobacillus montanus]